MKNQTTVVLLVLISMLSLSACSKESTVDLSMRFGNWTVTQCSEPTSGGTLSIPDEYGIFAFGDKIEYNSGNAERLRLLRTIMINGMSQLYEDYFICTLDGDKLTLKEETYGAGAGLSLTFTYQIQSLDGTKFILKRTDLGKKDGIVTMTRH